jgi:hypothetical protein
VLVLLFLLQWLLFFFEHRYFVDLMPLWLYACWLGVVWLVGKCQSRRGARVLAYVLILYLVGNSLWIGRTIAMQRQSDPLHIYKDGHYEGLPQFAQHIREHLPADALLVLGDGMSGSIQEGEPLDEPLTYLSQRRVISLAEAAAHAPTGPAYLVTCGPPEPRVIVSGKTLLPGPAEQAAQRPRWPTSPWTIHPLLPAPVVPPPPEVPSPAESAP